MRTATGDRHLPSTGGAHAPAVGALLVVAAIAGLHLLGHGALAAPPLDSLDAVRTWALARDPVTVAMAVARLLALAVAYHLVATTVLAALGRLFGRDALVRWADAATLPLFRSVVGRLAGLGISLSAAVAAPVPPAQANPTGSATLVAIDASGISPGDRSEPLSAEGQIVLERIDPSTPPNGTATQRVIDDARATTASVTMIALPPEDPPEAPPEAPDDLEAVPADATAVEVQWHRVEPGDHLWSIAERVITDRRGNPPATEELDAYWRALVDANPQLVDPDLLYPGEEVVVPPPPAPAGR
ncbi:hypothetical protein BH20ACT3_BH20ACT3_08300 [soil metagenome]